MSGLKLVDLIDVDTLQHLQDSFSSFTGVAALTTDENGMPITKGSGFTGFCMGLVRRSKEGRRRCEECDKNGAIMTLQSGQPVAYVCHAGLVDFAAPIIVEGKMVGSFIGGQVRMEESEEDKLRLTAKELSIDPDRYVEEVKKTRVIPREDVERAAWFISDLAKVLSHIAYHNYLTQRENGKIEGYFRRQSEYFMKINQFMKQQMSSMLVSAQNAEALSDAGKLQSTVDGLIRQGTSVITVVDHMSEYLSLTAGEMKISENIYNIRSLIRPIEELALSMERADLKFEFTVEEQVPDRLFGDSLRITYMINRLLDNRYMYTHSGKISFRVDTHMNSYATMLEIEVEDTGSEITDEARDEVFNLLKGGNISDLAGNADSNSSLAIIGILLYQMSGELSIDKTPSGNNRIAVHIPQLSLREED
ncbi:MAG: PocR ligand-binding domain-containing protein [Lachnospiraceae bacterium]|nr:PocR ligand-binding domain-containing protein [Lachnospiraceae bacterium]